jgi:hypothetical protein
MSPVRGTVPDDGGVLLEILSLSLERYRSYRRRIELWASKGDVGTGWCVASVAPPLGIKLVG